MPLNTFPKLPIHKDNSMKTQARVVVIGGGVVGCSVAYHLT